MAAKKDSFSDKLEVLKDTREEPVFFQRRLGVYYSGYINSYDEALSLLEDKNEKELEKSK